MQDRGREDPAPEPIRFRDPRQARIYRRLQLLGPGPAAFFLDACRLMTTPQTRLMTTPQTMLSTTHLLAHCLRDIESALRDVLETCDRGSRRSGGEQKASQVGQQNSRVGDPRDIERLRDT